MEISDTILVDIWSIVLLWKWYDLWRAQGLISIYTSIFSEIREHSSSIHAKHIFRICTVPIGKVFAVRIDLKLHYIALSVPLRHILMLYLPWRPVVSVPGIRWFQEYAGPKEPRCTSAWPRNHRFFGCFPSLSVHWQITVTLNMTIVPGVSRKNENSAEWVPYVVARSQLVHWEITDCSMNYYECRGKP